MSRTTLTCSHHLPRSRSQLGLKGSQKLLHLESRVRTISHTGVGQFYHNFTWLLPIAWRCVMHNYKPPSLKVKVTTLTRCKIIHNPCADKCTPCAKHAHLFRSQLILVNRCSKCQSRLNEHVHTRRAVLHVSPDVIWRHDVITCAKYAHKQKYANS